MTSDPTGDKFAQGPAVSVVMSVYNGETYLREAMDSVLTQTFQDFEFVIIEDGSTDGSAAILEEYATRDCRIRILPNAKNLGLTASLNVGLRAAGGRYIARMDADDVCMTERLQRQVDYLDRHHDIQLLGSGYVTIDAEGRSKKRDVEAAEPWECTWLSIFRPPLAHPTVMFRASLVTEHGLYFNETLPTAQDFDLWIRMMDIGKACALPEVLVHYRMHADNVSTRRRASQRGNMKEIALNHLFRRFPEMLPHATGFESFFKMLYGVEKAEVATTRDAVLSMGRLVETYIENMALTPTQSRMIWKTACRWLVVAVLREGAGANRPLVLVNFLISGRRFMMYAPLELVDFVRRRLSFS